jgi:hypothetical protein
MELLDKYIEKVKSCEFVDRQIFPKKIGVYLIFEKDKIIYIGESKNLYERINLRHISGGNTYKNSAFRRSLCKRDNKKPGIELREWILSNCKFKYIEVENKDLCSLIEKTLIYYFRKQYKLLNK